MDREATPRDENGDYDFEALEAVDSVSFNQQLQAMLRGEEVRLPRFNFRLGRREEGKRVKLGPEHIIIVEGIHGSIPGSCTPSHGNALSASLCQRSRVSTSIATVACRRPIPGSSAVWCGCAHARLFRR